MSSINADHAAALPEAFPALRVCNDEPIKARRVSHGGRCGRWARDNRVPATVLSAVAAMLIVGSWNMAADHVHAVARSANRATHFRSALAALAGARPEGAYLPPRGYVCQRAATPVKIDGKLDDAAWQKAPWTDDFVDILGDMRPAPRFRTRVKMLWDDQCFYIAAELEEPHVQASFTKHDSYIFHEDNDFEVFLNPDGSNHNYVELEMNALNTTWDLLLRKPYSAGGPADDAYEIEGLKTAVHVDGTLNDPRDMDRGWTIEIAMPWVTLGKLSKQAAPPRDGDQWRVNFSRVEWRFDVVDGKYQRIKNRPEDNWVWSPQGVVNMHRPEMWGYVQFSTAPVGQAAFRPDPAGPARHMLHRIYHAQVESFRKHKRYAPTLEALGLGGLSDDSLTGPPRLVVGADGYHVTADVRLPDGRRQRYRIRQDALIVPLGPED
jgi:hypothetical protein